MEALEFPDVEPRRFVDCILAVDKVVDPFSLAWAEEEEDGWEVGRGREEVAKVAEQAC